MAEIPIDIKIAFVDQIEAAVTSYKDDVFTYAEYRKALLQHSKNIFNAGRDSVRMEHNKAETFVSRLKKS